MAFSPAVNFHAAIYQRRPDVEAIVHLHSHYVSVLSSTGRTIGMYNVASVLFHEDQATFADDGVRPHLDVVDALGDKRVVLMKNHGAIVASQSLEHATIEAVMLEEAARYHLECEAIGGTEIVEAEVLATAGPPTRSTSCRTCGRPTSSGCAVRIPTSSPGSTG